MDRKTFDLQQIARFIGEQRQAEEALRLARKRLEKLSCGDDAIVYSRLPHDYTTLAFITENVKTCLGFSPEEWIAPGFWCEVLHPEDASGVLVTLERITETDARIHEYRLKHKNGGWRWIHDESRIVSDGNNRLVQIIGLWTDVTERRRAEERLYAAQKAFSKAFCESPAIVMLTSLKNRRCIEVNPSFERITGYDRREVIRRSPSRFYRWVDRKDLKELITGVTTNRTLRNLKVRFRTKHDEQRVGAVSVRTVEFGGEPCALTVVDVAAVGPPAKEKPRAADRKRSNRDRGVKRFGAWDKAFESTIDMISILDGDLTILKANRAFAGAFGRDDPAEVIGRKCYEIAHGTTRPPADCPHVRALATKEPVTAEFHIPETKTHVLVSVSPIFTDQGILLGCIHVAKDPAKQKTTPKTADKPDSPAEGRTNEAIDEVTPRQRQVLLLLREGWLTKEIAFQMDVSPGTVDFHKRTMMKNLGIKTLAELVHYAVTHKIAT